MFKKAIALILVVCLALPLAACGKATKPTIDTPLVVATAALSQKFSPFYADTEYDQNVVGLTQLGLLTTDRVGGIVYNAIKGETREYNGTKYTYKGITDVSVKINEDTTVYTIELKKGVKFSDGVEMTADDIIFNYYVYLDPSYVGSTTLSSYDIVGLKNYQTQTTDEVYDKYAKLADDIFAAGKDHKWASSDAWTEDLQKGYWDSVKLAWIDDCQAIVDYCVATYAAAYAEAYIGYTAAEVYENKGLQTVLGMALWGYGSMGADGVFTSAVLKKTFDVKNGVYPTAEDYYNECYAAYNGDCVAYWATEQADSDDVVSAAKTKFILNYGSKDESMGAEGIPSITGIKKLGKYKVEVTVNGYSAPAIYSICGITCAPMHYYGDKAKYDYEKNMFGHDFGDLSIVESKTNVPMGAGPYKFVEYKDKVVYYTANENYFNGCPKIAEVQFKEMADADMITAVKTGDADIANPSGSKAKFEEIRTINGGELDGAVITTNAIDNLGYGYIGLNADTVKVGTDKSSAASKALRKAFATILAVYRDVAINSYYGDAAAIINYPISNTSWAAPQKSDADYKVAFSVDVDGKDIYTSDMNAEARYDAALQAAIGYFKAAGFTWDEGSKKFTAAPNGAKLSYEVLVPADGTGDHPNFQILTNASKALATVGITLVVNDLSDSNVLWDRLDAGTQELWTAAWGSTIDPDMYQIYHSSNVVGLGGSDSNHYHIQDATLDQLIMDARASADQSYRKATYKACLDTIIDWAVEVPSYQRQNVTIFSSERVNIETVTPDITTYWGWMNDIELLEVYDAK